MTVVSSVWSELVKTQTMQQSTDVPALHPAGHCAPGLLHLEHASKTGCVRLAYTRETFTPIHLQCIQRDIPFKIAHIASPQVVQPILHLIISTFNAAFEQLVHRILDCREFIRCPESIDYVLFVLIQALGVAYDWIVIMNTRL
jgi:hypothetical protein